MARRGRALINLIDCKVVPIIHRYMLNTLLYDNQFSSLASFYMNQTKIVYIKYLVDKHDIVYICIEIYATCWYDATIISMIAHV